MKPVNKTKYFCVVHAGILLLCASMAAIAEDGGGTEVKSISKVSETVRQVDLAGKNMCVVTGTTSQFFEVDFSVTENRCEIQELAGGKNVERVLTLWCYELRARGKAYPYSRAIWTSRPVVGFRLCSDAQGKNYLAWVDGTSVRIEDVSESREMSDALISYLAKSDRYTVPVTHLVGREPFEGLNAIHSDIDIISVGEDKARQLRLVVMAPKTGEQYEFLFDSEGWNRLEK